MGQLANTECWFIIFQQPEQEGTSLNILESLALL